MASGEIFYVDILNSDGYSFYYNMVTELNEAVIKAVKSTLPDRLMTERAMNYRNNMLAGGLKSGQGPGEFGVMGNYNPDTKEIEYMMADQMRGICATVSANLAQEIIERAIYYCPKDTGYLAESFRIEDLGDGKVRIYNDCPYAWYVEEFTWKHHEYPTRAKFLTTAIYEITQKYGFGWA